MSPKYLVPSSLSFYISRIRLPKMLKFGIGYLYIYNIKSRCSKVKNFRTSKLSHTLQIVLIPYTTAKFIFITYINYTQHFMTKVIPKRKESHIHNSAFSPIVVLSTRIALESTRMALGIYWNRQKSHQNSTSQNLLEQTRIHQNSTRIYWNRQESTKIALAGIYWNRQESTRIALESTGIDSESTRIAPESKFGLYNKRL